MVRPKSQGQGSGGVRRFGKLRRCLKGPQTVPLRALKVPYRTPEQRSTLPTRLLLTCKIVYWGVLAKEFLVKSFSTWKR